MSIVDVYVERMRRVSCGDSHAFGLYNCPTSPICSACWPWRFVSPIHRAGVRRTPIQVRIYAHRAARSDSKHHLGRPFQPGPRNQPPRIVEQFWGSPSTSRCEPGEYLDGLLPALVSKEASAVGEMIATGTLHLGQFTGPRGLSPRWVLGAETCWPACCRDDHLDDRAKTFPTTSGQG